METGETITIELWAKDKGMTVEAALELARRQKVKVIKLKDTRIVNKKDLDNALIIEFNDQSKKQEKRLEKRREIGKNTRLSNALFEAMKLLGFNESNKNQIIDKVSDGQNENVKKVAKDMLNDSSRDKYSRIKREGIEEIIKNLSNKKEPESKGSSEGSGKKDGKKGDGGDKKTSGDDDGGEGPPAIDTFNNLM